MRVKFLSKNIDIKIPTRLLIRFMNIYRRFFLAAIVFSICTVSSVEAQVVLERVSITERADGRGVVIRNHLSRMPDSFRVLHAAENRIQFVIYSEGIDSDNFLEAVLTNDIERIDYYAGPGYFAYEVTLRSGIFYLGNAYPDVNQRDVLLGLERVNSTAVTNIIEPGLELFEQEPVEGEEASILDPERRYPDADDSDDERLSRINSTFGIKGGLTSANIYGVGFGRSSRGGVTIAASAVVDFPVYLPYDLSLGLETGVYFAQKGFIEPTSTKFIGMEVEFDYIEIPILAKMKYREQNRFSPHIVLGTYLGFLANAEEVREDGERNDLDEFTRSVDFGGMAGIGVDIRLGDVIVDLQIRQSLGFKTLFDEIAFDDGEKLRQISMVFGLRF